MNIDEFFQMVPFFVWPLLALGGPGNNALFVNPDRSTAVINIQIRHQKLCQRTPFKENLYTDTPLP